MKSISENKKVPSRAAKPGRKETTMTLEGNRIESLYELLHQLEHKDPDTAAVLKWAIFELERIYPA